VSLVATATKGTCRITATLAGSAAAVEVGYLPSSLAEQTVATFRADPPAITGSQHLADLDVGVASTGLASTAGTTVSFLLEAARPGYLVTVQASIPAALMGMAPPADVAAKLARWALSYQPQ
jgi:hypothetical protein